MIRSQYRKFGTRRCAMTLLEVVVAIGIVAILFAILLPAVQSARETARKTTCRNRLHQIGLAVHNFEAAHRHFPSNGWGYRWIGDPTRGVGERQPGGWIFNLLPFLDAQNEWSLARDADDVERRRLLMRLTATPIKIFKCPSRPAPPLSPANPDVAPFNADWSTNVAKTDYAINEGDWISDTGTGPASLDEGDDPGYDWRDLTRATGVSFQRSQVTSGGIADGLSQTILSGEKYVNRLAYSTNEDPGYDQSMYSGVDLDLNRWTIASPLQDAASNAERRFGSPHREGCFFLFCDGSVRQISYRIEATTYRALGNRMDRVQDPSIDSQ